MSGAVDDVTLLILGAGGDLTHRLLLPGVGSLLEVDPDVSLRVMGADRVDKTPEEWRSLVTDAFDSASVTSEVAAAALGRTSYRKVDVLDADQMRDLLATAGADGPLVVFFALPPAITMKVCAVLKETGVPEGTRLALEKPFGDSESGARSFNALLHQIVPEQQIFRIDHFLGLATVLNLIGLRFANRIFQTIWGSEHIERVEIVYDEELALEGRAAYYDTAGALRDMLQSHLLEVLAIFAMESIASLDSQELQDQKAQVLRATRLAGGSARRAARRARYTAGTIDGRSIPAYVDEPGVDPARGTETLAELHLEIHNNRWKGVPFLLRSGKALGAPRKQIVVHFRDVHHLPVGFSKNPEPDLLVIDLKPGSLALRLTLNAEGDPMQLEHKVLRADLAAAEILPYGEVLKHIIEGNQLLSVRADAAELCWHIVDPVLRAWAQDEIPLDEYPAGSRGPTSWPGTLDTGDLAGD